MEIRPSGSAASRRAPVDYFTGAVWQDPIVEAPAPGNVRASKMNVFAVRAAELTRDRPELAAAVIPLLNTREVIGRQIADLDRKVIRLAPMTLEFAAS